MIRTTEILLAGSGEVGSVASKNLVSPGRSVWNGVETGESGVLKLVGEAGPGKDA